MLKVFPELLFPSIKDIGSSLVKAVMHEGLIEKTFNSLVLIFKGYGLGILLALFFTIVAMINNFWRGIVEDIVLVAHPLPGIAIFPLCILWFGIGEGSIIFIVIHSVIWTLVLNMISGFSSIPVIYVEIGQSMGLNKLCMIKDIYIPASLSNILTGIKVGWARAWRIVICAELIFGVMGINSGLGWFILYKRNLLDIPGMFAAIIIIAIIGIFIEDFLFSKIEGVTVKKWGMIK